MEVQYIQVFPSSFIIACTVAVLPAPAVPRKAGTEVRHATLGPLRAHRALDDCVCLQVVVERVAESYGVSAADLLRPLVSRLDVAASAAQISTL